MNLILRRWKSNDECTIGELYDDSGKFVCFTLEDIVREVEGEPVSSWKVRDETAIPVGRYRVTITNSKRFKRPLPLLNMVEGFEGIRIHPGNVHTDTSGCILPGIGVHAGDKGLHESRVAFNKVYDLIDDALMHGDEVWLDVRNS